MAMSAFELLAAFAIADFHPVLNRGQIPSVANWFELNWCPSDGSAAQNGDSDISFFARLDGDGTLLRIALPDRYAFSDTKHSGAVALLLLELNSRTPFVQYQVLPDERQTIRIAADVPIYDGKLTAEQLRHVVLCLFVSAYQFEPVIRNAFDTGDIDFSLAIHPGQPDDHEELADLVKRAGGVEGLRKLLRER